PLDVCIRVLSGWGAVDLYGDRPGRASVYLPEPTLRTINERCQYKPEGTMGRCPYAHGAGGNWITIGRGRNRTVARACVPPPGPGGPVPDRRPGRDRARSVAPISRRDLASARAGGAGRTGRRPAAALRRQPARARPGTVVGPATRRSGPVPVVRAGAAAHVQPGRGEPLRR